MYVVVFVSYMYVVVVSYMHLVFMSCMFTVCILGILFVFCANGVCVFKYVVFCFLVSMYCSCFVCSAYILYVLVYICHSKVNVTRKLIYFYLVPRSPFKNKIEINSAVTAICDRNHQLTRKTFSKTVPKPRPEGVTVSMSRNFYMLSEITAGKKGEKLDCLTITEVVNMDVGRQ